MRVGIFFGGPAREREISFMGGRTAYQNLDRGLFEPVLIFVSGWGRFYRVEPEFLQKENLRDNFPTLDGFAVYDESLEDDGLELAEPVEPEWFEEAFDVALLALHGPDCEDGAIQGLLEWYKIPYTGTGLVGSAIGINKILQNELIALVTGQQKKTATITRDAWQQTDKAEFFGSLVAHLGLPVVVKAPHQGSSIGVAIVKEDNLEKFCAAVDQCFFTVSATPDGSSPLNGWSALSAEAKREFAQHTANLDAGIGYPLVIEETGEYITSPPELIETLDDIMASGVETVTLASVNAEDEVLFEEFIVGQEFSCGVIQGDDGLAVALPPTEIYNTEAFDFQTKYKSNVARKRIPVETSLENNRKIQLAVANVFTRLGINVYARIDGFLTAEGEVLLHDPNTIPGMSPASLIFKQMAEIGINITQSLTYLVRQSLRERIRTGKDTYRLRQMLADLDGMLADRQLPEKVIHFGPDDTLFQEAKAEYNRVAAEGQYKPVLMYLKNKEESHPLPTHLFFKETIAELDTALANPRHALLEETTEQAKHIVARYS